MGEKKERGRWYSLGGWNRAAINRSDHSSRRPEGKWDATTRRGNRELGDRMMGEMWLVVERESGLKERRERKLV